ncbi:hypothetical protein NQZ79_g2421 [Umbelopsis isabellina]|nr:hypothetical protein NQZ79_g2421 [Umbelopsis isabellina]
MVTVISPSPEVRLRGIDNLWLHGELPARLMTVSTLWTFDGPLNIVLVLQQLEKMTELFPKFRQIAVERGSLLHTSRWKDCENFSVSNHVEVVTLDEPTRECLQAFVSRKIALPFDYDRPLWTLYIINGLADGGSACFWKAHHAMSDGQGYVRALLACTSGEDELDQMVEEYKKKYYDNLRRVPSCSEVPILRRLPYRYQKHVQPWTIQLFATIATILTLLLGWILVLLRNLKLASCMLAPWWRRDFLYPGPHVFTKSIAWSDDVSMDDIAVVRKAFPGTLNDVMCAVITRSVKTYLDECPNKRQDKELWLLIPKSLRAPDDRRFQNVVSGSYAYFPMEDMSTRSLIKSIHQQMNLFKLDFIPYLLYFLANIFLLIPGILPSWLLAYQVQKIHGVFTNVPGPRKPIHFAGQEIKDYRVMPPQNSKGGIGMGLVSYGDKVALAILGDEADAYPGAINAICQNFKPTFDKMLLEAHQILDAKAKKLHEN